MGYDKEEKTGKEKWVAQCTLANKGYKRKRKTYDHRTPTTNP